MSENHERQLVLVTGAAGVVGSRIATELSQDFELKLTDIIPPASDPQPRHHMDFLYPVAAPESVQPADLLDFNRVNEIMRGVDAVVHLAIASLRTMTDRPQAYIDDEIMKMNVLGTQHVFEAARQNNVKKIVFMSSMMVTLGKPRLEKIERNAPARPFNLYACTKIFGEHLGEFYAREHGISVICLRLGQPFPTDRPFREWRERKLEKHRGSMSIFVGFEDIAQAVRCALRAPQRYQVANIVSASEESTIDLSAAAEFGYRPVLFATRDGLVKLPQPETPAKGGTPGKTHPDG